MNSRLKELAVGDVIEQAVPTPKDVDRAVKAASRYGMQNDKGFRCKTDRKTRIMTVTRVR